MGLAQALLLLVACSRGLGKSTNVLKDAQVVDALRVRYDTGLSGIRTCLTTSSSTTQATFSTFL